MWLCLFWGWHFVVLVHQPNDKIYHFWVLWDLSLFSSSTFMLVCVHFLCWIKSRCTFEVVNRRWRVQKLAKIAQKQPPKFGGNIRPGQPYENFTTCIPELKILKFCWNSEMWLKFWNLVGILKFWEKFRNLVKIMICFLSRSLVSQIEV